MFDWHAWRSQGLGASDSPAVMGVSPYTTPYELWEKKTGLVKDDNTSGNWATRRGNELEPRARAHYEFMTGIEMPVAFIEHHVFPFIRASLDGYNEEKQIVLEIKCPGKDDHELAKSGKVPEKYWPQVQHQLFVTGAKKVDYFSFDGETGVIVEVFPDEKYIEKLVVKLHAFWGLVLTKEPPPLSDKDFKKITDEELKFLIKNYSVVDSAIKDLETQKKDLREKILARMTHPNMRLGDTKIYRTYRKGTIDYSKIDFDFEPYRKEGSFSYTIKLGNE
jgi:putative phage-type endonuclease